MLVGEELVKLFKERGADEYRGVFCTWYTLEGVTLGMSNHGCSDAWFVRTTQGGVGELLGDENYRALMADVGFSNNIELAKSYLPVIRMYAEGRTHFTAGDLYRDGALGLYDIPMYLALAALVRSGELEGPDPYLVEPVTHDELVYHVPPECPCDVCRVAPAAYGGTKCVGCIIATAFREPCRDCTLDCDRGPLDHCPF
jgi:hypothetical protein